MNKPSWHFALALTVLAVSASLPAHAAGQSSANFIMKSDVVNAGADHMTSTNFRLSSSLGETVAGGGISSVSFQLQSGFRATLYVPPVVLNLLSVFSRKFHGATPFELTIDHTQLITGTISVEPRAQGGGHTLCFVSMARSQPKVRPPRLTRR